MKKQRFWCETWGQQIYEEVCIHRFKKGLKKCEGCAKGKELLVQEIAELKEENEQYWTTS